MLLSFSYLFLSANKYKCKMTGKMYIDLKLFIQYLVTLSDIFYNHTSCILFLRELFVFKYLMWFWRLVTCLLFSLPMCYFSLTWISYLNHFIQLIWKGCFLLITKTVLFVCWRDLVFGGKKKSPWKIFLLPLSIKEGNIFSVSVASWKKEICIKIVVHIRSTI